MTYAIAKIVVGMEMPDPLRSFFDERGIGYDEINWQSSYSGNGITPVYSGIIIGEFDECNNCKAQNLIQKLTPTPAQWQAGQAKMNQTRESVREFLENWEVSDEEKLTPAEIQKLMDSLPLQAECLVIWGSS